MNGKTIYNLIETGFLFGATFVAALVVISIAQDFGAMNGDQAAAWRLLALKVVGGLAAFTYCLGLLEWLRLQLLGKEKNDDKASNDSASGGAAS